MKKNKWMLASTAVLGTAFIAACGADNSESSTAEGENSGSSSEEKTSEDKGEKSSGEVTVEHELGETTVPEDPENVVVFNYEMLETLDELNVGVNGVAQESLPSYLDDYSSDEYENIGSLKEPDFEAINAMEPDVIIISGRQSEAYEELSEIAPTVYTAVDTENYMESFDSNMEMIGEIFQKEDQVQEKVDELHTRIDDLKETTEDAGPSLVTLVNDGSLSVYGEGSRFGLIHDVFGVPAADENIESSTHGQSASYEYLAEEDPEHLFVVDRSAVVSQGGEEQSAAETLDNDIVNETEAAQNDNIHYLDPEYWYLSGGGLQSMDEMITEIEEAVASSEE
ncbi:siderophore ABC transporter substrate-binding protein [Marinococcus halotolerans]|uniref:siderophore ABC transporter substrate-binding protein n=1 Tax=Marinococcus halotolerans TaxID=301092 RepID=UPI0003B30107|nr:siderophore ABC transporter substrate-binding protein [Marinococcus halotolerans]